MGGGCVSQNEGVSQQIGGVGGWVIAPPFSQLCHAEMTIIISQLALDNMGKTLRGTLATTSQLDMVSTYWAAQHAHPRGNMEGATPPHQGCTHPYMRNNTH
jgi:hypothetical protein